MKTLWKNDNEFYEIAKKELFVALVGDILDKMGYQHQFLPPNIKPLEADVFEESSRNSHNPVMKKPFGIMFEALDSLKEGEVYICSGASPRYYQHVLHARCRFKKGADPLLFCQSGPENVHQMPLIRVGG